ncbi:MAG: hypothetical protein BZY88_14350 [SAR202 cluster bacterium Io17-Chloro-G9]|nr:MAG: hypothetical protein BZY88_14350 [SAR202 cluster bacterium Io17-Chloro-G9]
MTTTVRPEAPFDFDLTAGYHTYFQGRYGTDSLEDGEYRRLLDLGDKLVLASVRSEGTIDAPELTVEFQGDGLTSEEAAKASSKVAWLLGTDQDLAPFYAMADTDPVMSSIAGRFRGLHLPHTASLFEALVLGIMGQQIATNVARIIRTLFIETYGPRQVFDGQTYYAFPRPEALLSATVEDLRGMKLSWRKAEYIRGIVEAAMEGALSSEHLSGLTDEQVEHRLTELRGVGRWTVQWVLIRSLGRPDALPLGDLALRRAVSMMYFNGEEINDVQLEEFSRRWSPWRSYATVYLFTALRKGMG